MVDLIIFLILIVVGYTVGTLAEKRHYRSIQKRENAFLKLPAVTLKDVDYPPTTVKSAQMVYGSAVIQNTSSGSRYAVYITSDGLVTRKQGS